MSALPAKVNPIKEKIEGDMFANLVEKILPVIGPMIEPASEKLVDFLKENNYMILAKVTDKEKGEVSVFFLREDKVTAFKIESHEEMKTHNLKEFVQKLITGNIGK